MATATQTQEMLQVIPSTQFDESKLTIMVSDPQLNPILGLLRVLFAANSIVAPESGHASDRKWFDISTKDYQINTHTTGKAHGFEIADKQTGEKLLSVEFRSDCLVVNGTRRRMTKVGKNIRIDDANGDRIFSVEY